ncbi:MAG TPA: cytochrome c [Candidatus Acidoferrum sp.]|nr:cytochrome c [Candidatus Acidoferrum sp.]
MRTRFQLGALVLSAAALTACRQDMHDQPKYIALRPSSFFNDGRSARPIPDNTIARGHLDEDRVFYTGRDASGKLVNEFPIPITKEVILRGQDRFNVYCTPCHDQTGSGNGMVAQRGFRHPPSYHTERLIQMPVGHFFDVITNGLGAMQDYSAQVQPVDRWAIAAYIRVLQLSQSATINDVPAAARAQMAQGGGK